MVFISIVPNGKKVYGLVFLIGSKMLVGLFSNIGVSDGLSSASNDFPDFLFLIGLTRLADGLSLSGGSVSGGSECK